jgi:hypothetical protein
MHEATEDSADWRMTADLSVLTAIIQSALSTRSAVTYQSAL